MSEDIAVQSIHPALDRYRSVDHTKMLDIARSMEHDGLLQPIGVVVCTCVTQAHPHYQLVFGAHRLDAAQELGWETLDATVLPSGLAPEQYRLMELQENVARHDLTGVQRKQFAAEIGRLLSEIRTNSDSPNRNDKWFIEIGKQISIPSSTLYDWWNTFCKDTNLDLTPRHALDIHKQQFFDWLEAQQQAAEAEKQRRAAEARLAQQRQDCTDAVEHLLSLATEYGVHVVKDHILTPYFASIGQNNTTKEP